MYPKEVDAFLHNFLGKGFNNLSSDALSALSVAFVEKEVSNQRMQTLLEKNSLEVAKALKHLTDIELLTANSKGRWTTYKINYEYKHSGLSNGLSNGLSKSESTTLSVLKLIQENSYITRKELSSKLGISITAIQKHINKLKFNNKIKREGPATNGGRWEILSD